MAQRFKAKTLLSNSGVFNNEVIAPNLVYNTGNQIISGVKTFLDDLNISGDLTLNGGLYINDIEELNLTGANIYADNLVYNTGNQTISGTKTFDVAPILNGNQLITGNLSLYATTANLISTGSQIDILSGQVVFNTGNQTISGIKTFATGVVVSGNLQVSGTGIFNALDLNNIDNLSFSGVDVTITSGNVILTNPVVAPNIVYNTGNQTISGIKTFIGNQNISGNLNVTGNILLSGNPVLTGVDLSSYATTANLTLTGSTLQTNINNLSGVSVFTTGNQTISGIKSFATGIDIINSGNPQSLRVFNRTGLNTGEFAFFGWNTNNQLTIGAQQTNSGILRDVTLTGANININASGVLNIFDPVNITGNVTITGHLSASSKSFLIDHPNQIGKKLQYGSLEGPEHGVFVRGKTNENIINLPNYWPALVDENSISVNLTPISVANNIYVVDYNNQRVITDGNNGNDYFYTVYGERKDIPKLTVEF